MDENQAKFCIDDNTFELENINKIYQTYEVQLSSNFDINGPLKELNTIQELEKLIDKQEKNKDIKFFSLSDDDIIKINRDIDSFKEDIENNIIDFDDRNFKKEYTLLKYDYHKNIFNDTLNIYEKKVIITNCLYFDNIRHINIDQKQSSSNTALLKIKSKPYEMKKYIKEKIGFTCIFKYKPNGIDYSIFQWCCSNPFEQRNYDYSFNGMYLLIQVCKNENKSSN